MRVGQYARELNAATERTKEVICGQIETAQATRALQTGEERRFWRWANGSIDF
jgi:hypothetical protein